MSVAIASTECTQVSSGISPPGLGIIPGTVSAPTLGPETEGMTTYYENEILQGD